MNLGELAPYVVRTDHDGVELELPGLPSEVGRLVSTLLVFGMLSITGDPTKHPIWLGCVALLALLVVFWNRLMPGRRLHLRLEPHRLVMLGDSPRIVPTLELSRIDTTDTSLLLWRLDGSADTLDLPLEDPFLMEELARLLQHNVVRGERPAVPDSLRRLRERSPQ